MAQPRFQRNLPVLALAGVLLASACGGSPRSPRTPADTASSAVDVHLSEPTAQLTMTAGTVFQGDAPNVREVGEVLARIRQRLATAGLGSSRTCRLTGTEAEPRWALVTAAYPVDATGKPTGGTANWDLDLMLRATGDSAAAAQLLGVSEGRRVWVFLVNLPESEPAGAGNWATELALEPEHCKAEPELGDTQLVPPGAPLVVLSYDFRRASAGVAFVPPADDRAESVADQFAASGLWQIAP
jgi:hypothetical protein